MLNILAARRSLVVACGIVLLLLLYLGLRHFPAPQQIYSNYATAPYRGGDILDDIQNSTLGVSTPSLKHSDRLACSTNGL